MGQKEKCYRKRKEFVKCSVNVLHESNLEVMPVNTTVATSLHNIMLKLHFCTLDIVQ
jgi:hypothetical protein